MPLSQFQVQNDRLVVPNMTEDQLKALPAYTRAGEGFRQAENTFRADVNPFR